MNRIVTFLAGARRAMVELGIFSVVVNLLLLTMPIYMLQVYDRVLSSGSSDTLLFLSVIAAAALVLLGLIEAVRGIYAARIGSKLEARMGRGALMASLYGPRASLGDVQPLRDMQQVRAFLSGRSVFAIFDLPFAPIFILFLYFVHPALFWLTVVGAVALAIIAVANQRATQASGKRSGEAAMAANLSAQAFARNRESLVAMGMVDNVVDTWGKDEARSLSAQDEATRVNSWFAGLSRTIRMGLQIAILGYGAALVLRGEMTAGMIFASSIISGRALQPIDQIIGGWKGFIETGRAWTRLSSAVAPFEDEAQPTEQAVPKGRIDLENAVYAVPVPGEPSGKMIIKRVSARIQPGESVGVIGLSGAGKSTLLRLMVGALNPNSGTVRLDGADLRNWPAAQRGKYMGYLGQDTELLPGTVKENIARFSPDASDEEVRAAADRAGVTDLINSLPRGFETRIGPGGHVLSGGERQRIGLSRAFYGMPRVLVLDEPNAALDESGLAALEGAIAAAKEAGATVIIAAQRREILRHLDKVMVVEDGTITKFDDTEAVGRWMQERAGHNVAQLRAPNKPKLPAGEDDAPTVEVEPANDGTGPREPGEVVVTPPPANRPAMPQRPAAQTAAVANGQRGTEAGFKTLAERLNAQKAEQVGGTQQVSARFSPSMRVGGKPVEPAGTGGDAS